MNTDIGRFVVWALIVLLSTGASAADDEKTLWQVLRNGNHVALLRHALAPGTGDPAHFKLGDCSTQRNLSERGRKQAVRIGERFQANGINTARVLSSQWCRCLDTAELLGLGPVEEWPVINSFFRRMERAGQQTQELKQWLEQAPLTQPTVLVTHQVNITALTGVYPSSGELVLIRRAEGGEISVIGTIETD